MVKNRADRRTYKKVFICLVVFFAAAVVVIGTLAGYMIKDYDKYHSQVIDQITGEYDVNPERGQIVDRNGVVLATNIKVYDIIISPDDIKEKAKTVTEKNSDDSKDNDVLYEWKSSKTDKTYTGTDPYAFICTFLSDILEVDYNEIHEKSIKPDRKYELIKKEVSEEDELEIMQIVSDNGLKGLVYDSASSKRYYPFGSLASHVIGYVGTEGTGVSGVELYYNNILEGTSGHYLTAQDALSREMPFEFNESIAEVNGQTVRLTIDVYIQTELEKQLEKTYHESKAGNRVMGLVMETDTAAVLAMATYPSFDLNDPYKLDEDSQKKLDELDPESDEYMKKYSELLYTMWKNKVITETYEPGSTFKVITTAMARDTELVPFEQYFTCTGSLQVEGFEKPISCHEQSGHGTVTYRVGLQQSCNPTLMQVAQIIGVPTFYDYFESFGYTSTTGIDLPFETKTIAQARNGFSGVNLAVYSFGQTFKTTAIQHLTALSAVANGGYYNTPHVMMDILDENGASVTSFGTDTKRQVISSDASKEISEVLEEGVSGNGAARNAYVMGYKVAAKTGTSEKRDKYDENGVASYRVGSCMAYAPSDDPLISALIVVDEPMIESVYGSTVAAPYISELLSEILPYLGVERQYTESDLEKLEISVSDYTGATTTAAIDDLTLNKLSYEIVGSGGTVVSQSPAAGTVLKNEGGKIILYTDSSAEKEYVTVPDLVGITADAAENVLIYTGLNLKVNGATNGSSSTVISQSITPGITVEKGTVVEITLRYLGTSD